MITIGEKAVECCPVRFEDIQFGATAFLAPYWMDNDPSAGGSVSYAIFSDLEGSSILQNVSNFISRNQSTTFNGVWMLVAFWSKVPEQFFEQQVQKYIGQVLSHDMSPNYC